MKSLSKPEIQVETDLYEKALQMIKIDYSQAKEENS